MPLVCACSEQARRVRASWPLFAAASWLHDLHATALLPALQWTSWRRLCLMARVRAAGGGAADGRSHGGQAAMRALRGRAAAPHLGQHMPAHVPMTAVCAAHLWSMRSSLAARPASAGPAPYRRFCAGAAGAAPAVPRRLQRGQPRRRCVGCERAWQGVLRCIRCQADA